MKKVILAIIITWISFHASGHDIGDLEKYLRVPNELLVATKRTFKTQNNKCTVLVTEQLVTKPALIGTKEIVIPYICKRPDHMYKCGAGKWAAKTDATYVDKVTAKYSLKNGILKLTNISDPGNNEERNCGAVLTQHLRSISVQ